MRVIHRKEKKLMRFLRKILKIIDSIIFGIKAIIFINSHNQNRKSNPLENTTFSRITNNTEQNRFNTEPESKLMKSQKSKSKFYTIFIKIIKMISFIFLCFIAQNSRKYTSDCIYGMILSILDIPICFSYILQRVNFNFLMAIYNIIKITEEKNFYDCMLVSIPQFFLIYQNIAFCVPILFSMMYRYIRSSIGKRPTYFAVNFLVLIGVIVHSLIQTKNYILIPETDHYIMDRAQISIENAYNNQIEGKFDIIKVHEEIESSEPETIADNLSHEKNITLENAKKKKYRREYDSFFKNGDLIRLLHIPNALYLATNEEKIDTKFNRVFLSPDNLASGHLWRLVLSEKKEYLRSGEFFRLKNESTGQMLGIRTDGIIGCSNESRKNRQKLIITECENHPFYKTVQDNSENLKKAQSRINSREKLVVYDLGFGISFLDILIVILLILFFILDTYIYYCHFKPMIIDLKILGLFFLTLSCLFIRNNIFFRSGLALIVLRILRNLYF